MTTATIAHIDEQRLERDLGYRFGYLADFIEVGPNDIECIKASAEWLSPLVPSLVDAIYVKLFSFDATKRHFVARQTGYEGELPKSIDELSLDHEQIQFRKHHLGKYLARLVTGAYDPKMVSYLDFVGKMHTPKAGSKDLNVPLVQMNALMGFVADALIATVLASQLDCARKTALVRAFSKLLWIQNDLISRHYLN